MPQLRMNRMPNQTGSKPKVVTMGRKTGEQIIHIPTGSMNMPRMKKMNCMIPIIISGGMARSLIRERMKSEAPPAV